MKFSDISAPDWEQLKTYLDTCVLPLALMTGEETPVQVTEALEKLRDVLDKIEGPFKGRTVTYPAIQYVQDVQQLEAQVDHLCKKLKANAFTYVIVAVTASPLGFSPRYADLIVSGDPDQNAAAEIQQLWR